MVKLINLTRVVTSILVIFVLLFVYSNLPERVGLLYSPSGLVDFYLDKNEFFYITLILSLVLNLITVLFVKVFQTLPVNADRFFFTNDWFKERFSAWIASLAPIMNMFFVFTVVFIGIYNHGDLELIESYSYLAYLGQFLVLGWLFTLIFLILNKSNK